ncbi:uncharacterized protein LOC122089546 [Macadamia integrifolia]|uniref:uncharacterized protein LOC122089546 n=1 Tax=Macadamia integrifolia TaxID=60698 RepID=UPI001C4E32FD|nr:uncharacterized protein LOC122089546 [Macadamia integrifolia]
MSPAKMPEPVLRRMNSIAELNLSSKDQNLTLTFPILNGGNKVSHVADDLELISFRSQTKYTSLKDLLPSPLAARIQSPDTTASAQSGYEISIKNHLVKQAARAYLQPKSVSPNSSGRHFFLQLWVRFSREYLWRPVNVCSDFINQHIVSRITGAFHQFFGLIWVGKNQGR